MLKNITKVNDKQIFSPLLEFFFSLMKMKLCYLSILAETDLEMKKP